METADYDPGEIFRELLTRTEVQERQDKPEPPVVKLSKRSQLFRFRWVAAVVLIIVLGGGLYFITFHKHEQNGIPSSIASKKSLAPGSDRAVLTLASGQIGHFGLLGDAMRIMYCQYAEYASPSDGVWR